MQQKLMHTYHDLMASLEALPNEIGEAEQERVTLRQSIAKLEQATEERRIAVILGAGGWAALGKNEGERDINLKDTLRQDTTHRKLDAELTTLRSEAEELAQFISSMERQYGATCYKVRLAAAFMNYIAGAGNITAAPVATSNGAEAIGL